MSRTAISADRMRQLEAATRDLSTPYAVVDLDAYRWNADDLLRRAAGKPIRVASKSIRSRALLREALSKPGFAGVLAFTVPEALWLADEIDDVVVGYPTADTEALARLGADDKLAAAVTLMVDDPEQLELIRSAVGASGPPIRLCIDLDASLKLAGGRVHLGTRRSPIHSTDQAVEFAKAIVADPRFKLVGLMAYEGQIAGVGDNQPGPGRFAVRAMQWASARELAERRAEVVAAIRAVAPIEFVNGGGTGSLEQTGSEDAVTELAAGSGLLAPALFDDYTRFTPRPAAYFVLSVVRRPAADVATVLGGGWIASGPAEKSRLPVPSWPLGLELTGLEGAGEVQTPLVGFGASELKIGDRVWFRHAKAGELCERVDVLHLVEGDRIVDTAPTYRGEGHAFL